ncbi:Protein NCA1, partial [Mucuna pruriens]
MTEGKGTPNISGDGKINVLNPDHLRKMVLGSRSQADHDLHVNTTFFCSRAMGDASSAVAYFEESAQFLSKLPKDDLEITHTLSVSLNKIGDLKYYEGDLQAARSYYFKSLNVRRDVVNNNSNVPSQVLDVAVSLAKVADVDRNLGDEKLATDGFQEAIDLLESLTLESEASGLVQRISKKKLSQQSEIGAPQEERKREFRCNKCFCMPRDKRTTNGRREDFRAMNISGISGTALPGYA